MTEALNTGPIFGEPLLFPEGDSIEQQTGCDIIRDHRGYFLELGPRLGQLTILIRRQSTLVGPPAC